MTKKIQPYVSATMQLGWFITPLIVICIITLLFSDNNFFNEIFLLPWWGFISVNLLTSANQKYIHFSQKKENSIQNVFTYLNMTISISLLAMATLTLCLIHSKSPSIFESYNNWQESLLVSFNIIIFFTTCMLYFIGHARQIKQE